MAIKTSWGEGLLWGIEGWFRELQRNTGFYLTIRNPSAVQLELISKHVEGLRPGTLKVACWVTVV